MTIYDRIDEILRERQLSRRALARLAGIKETTLAGLFARKPDVFPEKYIDAISNALNVSSSYLQGFADTPEAGEKLDILAREIQSYKKAVDGEIDKLRPSVNKAINNMDQLGVLLLSYLLDSFYEYDNKEKEYYLNDKGISMLAHYARKEIKEKGDGNDPQEQ